MIPMSRRVQLIASAAVVVLLALAFLIFPGGGSRTVTAHFERAVAVYPGTDLRVMGVRVGEVTAVVPDGNSVRVEMTYDAEYDLPADAKAAVVTPTLIADRFVQMFPAYSGGAKLADEAVIPIDRTQSPVELDRMYKALDDLSTTLGPQGGETRGALDNLLSAGAKALDGNGAAGSKMIRSLSEAADTFARNRGPLFDNVRSLAEITETLAANDALMQDFLTDLTAVSGQLEGEKDEIRQVLEALADVLGTVEGFVKTHRGDLRDDVSMLASLLDRVDRQKDALGVLLSEGPLALGNLHLAFDANTGSFGSRLQATQFPTLRPDHLICQILTVNAGAPDSVCPIVYNLLQPILPTTQNEPNPTGPPSEDGAEEQGAAPEGPPASSGEKLSLKDLLGGALG